MTESLILPSGRRAALAHAIKKLPLLPGKSGEFEALYLESLSHHYSVQDLPQLREVSPDTARAELETLVSLMGKLRDHIAGMHRTSFRAIENLISTIEKETADRAPEESHPLELAKALEVLQAIFWKARVLIAPAETSYVLGGLVSDGYMGQGGFSSKGPPVRGKQGLPPNWLHAFFKT